MTSNSFGIRLARDAYETSAEEVAIFVCMYTYICVCIHIYREIEREEFSSELVNQ